MSEMQDQDFSTHIETGIWRRFLHIAAIFRRELILLAIAMIGLAILESVPPLLTKYAIDTFIARQTTDGITGFILVFLMIITLQAAAIRIFLFYAGRVEIGLCYEIRKAGFDRLQDLSFSYYDRTPVGWILSRLISDTSRLSEVVAWGIVDVAWGFTTILVIITAMFILSWRLALAAVVVIPLLAAASWFFQRRLLRSHQAIRRINSRITSSFNEGIMGARTSKTLRRETLNNQEFAAQADDLYRHSVRAGTFAALFMPVVSLLGAVGAALVLSIGGDQVVRGVLLTGTLYVFFTYVTRIWDPIKQLARVLTDLQSAQAAAERVMSLLNEQPEIADRPEVSERYGTADGYGREPWPTMQGKVEFRDVGFAYRGGEQILSHFNLTVEPGQVVALVGETGAGKSTLVNLACRFYEPSAGQILVDGADYRERPLLWLYSNLGYVLQSPHLFSGTIAENIRYGNLQATPEQISQAARMVNADGFISRLERGYDTEVGEGGNRLSTGEKQLVSFARAILADPRIFVLDEATSSVDTETEALIQQAIQVMLQGRTAFVIAHRLSTIRHADRILVIHDGRVVEDGTHQQLLRRRGAYYQLYLNQFIQESIDQ